MTLRLNGDSSGFTEIKAPNDAGSNSITLPTSNGGANQLLQNGGTAGSLQYTSAGGGLRYDSAGRVLVGASSYSLAATTVLQGNNLGVNEDATIRICRGSTPGGNADLGLVTFSDNNANHGAEIRVSNDRATSWAANDYPTKITFGTTSVSGSSPTARVAIGSDGALRLLAGCPGIDFSATQPAGDAGTTMSTEILDSYEEGNWTPTIRDAGQQGTWSVTAQRCRYIKVGRMVSVSGVLSSIGYDTNAANPTSYLQIMGMPFTKVNGAFSSGSARVNNMNFGADSYMNVEPITGSATNILYLRRSINGSGGADFQATSIINGAAAIVFQLTYEADDA